VLKDKNLVMVTIRLKGGLGNQMFQYAAAKSLAALHDTEVAIDKNWFYSQKDSIPRNYELSCFDNISPKFSSGSENFFLKRKWEYLKLNKFKKFYVEPTGGDFDEKFFNLPSDIHLEGYFQSEKYFEQNEKIIRNEFSFDAISSNDNEEMLRKIRDTESVSIHVRRGDYVSNSKTNKKHGVCHPDYYSRAIAHIEQNVEKPVFFVFSDDMEWTKNNLKIDQLKFYIDYNKGKGSFEDMRLMSKCRHNIIANSSFSWWGAWLNNNSEKIVLTPKRWFNIERSTKDLIPNTWIQL